MENNENNHQSAGIGVFVLFLVGLGAIYIGLIKSDPRGFMGASGAIVVGGLGLLIAPFALVFGRFLSFESIKETFSLDFSEPSEESEEKSHP